MLPSVKGALLALLTTTSLAHPFDWPHMPWWEFDIMIVRHSTIDCTAGSELGKQVEVRHGNCHAWDDDYAFTGVGYIWSAHRPAGEDPTSYGQCIINVWDNKECAGERIGYIAEVSLSTRAYPDVADCFRLTSGKTSIAATGYLKEARV